MSDNTQSFADAVSAFFLTGYDDDGNAIFSAGGITVIVLLMVAALLIGVIIFGKRTGRATAKRLAFSAVAIALASVCSMIKLIHMPMGGSVTLFSMLIISLVGYWFGLGGGLTAAFAYGLIQLLLGAYIVSLPQMLVDYIFSFMALGLSGIFSKAKYGLLKGYITAVAGRYIFAVISGVIFFATFMPEFFNSPVLYSMAYNGAYMGLEAAITIVVIALPPVRKAMAKVKEYATDGSTKA